MRAQDDERRRIAQMLQPPSVSQWYQDCLIHGRDEMMHKSMACRLVMQLPAEVAWMSHHDFASYVRTHWNEWQDKWRQVNGNRAPGEFVKVAAGERLILIEKGGKHYLLTEGTRIVFAAVA
jgi:hypothetical protein